MTDERILPPFGFRYGNYPLMLDSHIYEPLARGLHPMKGDNKTEVNGVQGTERSATAADKAPQTCFVNLKNLRKTTSFSPSSSTEMKKNTDRKTGGKENIKIPGFSEKSINFPSLSVEKEYVAPGDKLQITNSNLQINPKPQMSNKSQTLQRKNQQTIDPEINNIPRPAPIHSPLETSGGEPDEVSEKSQNPLVPFSNTVELEQFENPRQEYPIKRSKEPGNKLQVPNYKQITGSELQINSKIQLTEEFQITSPGIQPKSKPQMSNKSQTLHRKNRQNSGDKPGEVVEISEKSQKPEAGGGARTKFHGKTSAPAVGVNEPRVFNQQKDKIEFSDSPQVEDKATEIETQLPDRVEKTGTHTPIPVIGSDKPQKTELVKDKVVETQFPGKTKRSTGQASIHMSGSEEYQEPAAIKKGIREIRIQDTNKKSVNRYMGELK